MCGVAAKAAAAVAKKASTIKQPLWGRVEKTNKSELWNHLKYRGSKCLFIKNLLLLICNFKDCKEGMYFMCGIAAVVAEAAAAVAKKASTISTVI